MSIKPLHTLFIILIFTICCSNSTVHAAERGHKFTVVIDAGHGGHDPGAIGRTSKEKNINLKVALKVGELIEDNCNDVRVVYTRKRDVFIPLDRRAQIANNAKGDLFISIHTNSMPKGKIARGAETYTLGMARASENLRVAKKENSVILIEKDYKQRYAGFNPNSAESYVIFEFMQDKYMAQSVKLARMMQRQFRNTAKRLDKGVHQAGFLVLRETSMPSILIELGYISTSDEEAYLNSRSGVNDMSKSIYRAFVNYKNEHTGIKSTINPSSSDSDNSRQEARSIEVADSSAPRSSDSRDESATVNRSQPKTVQNTTEGKPVFKVQIGSSSTKISTTSSKFKGESNVKYYVERGVYKYTKGASTDYNLIYKEQKRLSAKFKDAFIIAFRNGKKMDVVEAIREFNKSR